METPVGDICGLNRGKWLRIRYMRPVWQIGTEMSQPEHGGTPSRERVTAGGEALPQPEAELAVADALFAGPGEDRAKLRAVNWSKTRSAP